MNARSELVHWIGMVLILSSFVNGLYGVHCVLNHSRKRLGISKPYALGMVRALLRHPPLGPGERRQITLLYMVSIVSGMCGLLMHSWPV